MAPDVGPEPASLPLVFQGPACAMPRLKTIAAQPASTGCLVITVASPLVPSFEEQRVWHYREDLQRLRCDAQVPAEIPTFAHLQSHLISLAIGFAVTFVVRLSSVDTIKPQCLPGMNQC